MTRQLMVGADGAEYPSEGVFREVTPPERLVTTDEWGEDFDHEVDLQTGIVVTCLLEDLGEKTRLTLCIVHPNEESRKEHEEMGVVTMGRSEPGAVIEPPHRGRGTTRRVHTLPRPRGFTVVAQLRPNPLGPAPRKDL